MKTFLTFYFMTAFHLGLAQSHESRSDGKELFEHKCKRCHGKDGTKGLFGAKNLQLSRLQDSDLTTIISKGKNGMPRWEKRLSQQEIESVIVYVKTLRK